MLWDTYFLELPQKDIDWLKAAQKSTINFNYDLQL
jgi:hypothetical protein